MPIFYHTESRTAILVNYKCGFTSLKHVPTLQRIDKMSQVRKIELLKKCNNVFMISRDPVKRIQSFYRHWMMVMPEQCKTSNDLLYWGVFKGIKHYLNLENLFHRKVSLSGFINKALLKGYGNAHITPQHVLFDSVKDPDVNVKILKLEDGAMQHLEAVIGISIPKLNVTNHTKFPPRLNSNFELSNDDRAKLIEYYQKDYELFGKIYKV